jgi:hypothetical protein
MVRAVRREILALRVGFFEHPENARTWFSEPDRSIGEFRAEVMVEFAKLRPTS